MIGMIQFEELLNEFERVSVTHYHANVEYQSARSALVEYVRERVEAERHATRALVYFGARLSTLDKSSAEWIAEALSATKEVPR